MKELETDNIKNTNKADINRKNKELITKKTINLEKLMFFIDRKARSRNQRTKKLTRKRKNNQKNN